MSIPVRTVGSVIDSLPVRVGEPLSVPPYAFVDNGRKVALAVESMKRHMTDEGWQIMAGLESAGYSLAGLGLETRARELKRFNLTHVPEIISFCNPDTVVVQDKREWEGLTADRSRDPAMRFEDVCILKVRTEIYKVTILKDAQHDNDYQRKASEEMGCHAWIVYYHPRIVKHLAPFVREQHLIRTYHTVDRDIVPPLSADRLPKALLSGALSGAYPWRAFLRNQASELIEYRLHSGYHRQGCETPEYLKTLSHYKVAVCTSSIYGYALRKIIEATACGCIVVTDLPKDDTLPEIDDNLVRVCPKWAMQFPKEFEGLVRMCLVTWDPNRQRFFAEKAMEHYDYRTMGRKLAADIEEARRQYEAR